MPKEKTDKDIKYIDHLEKKGYMVFSNIKELKEIILETMDYSELVHEVMKRHIANDCGCSE